MKVSGQPSLSRAATREKREREVAVDSSCDEVAFEGQDRSPRPFGDLPRCCSIVALALSQQDTSRDTRWELRQLLVYSGTAARRRREARRAMVFIRDGEILQDGDPRASAPGASPSQQTPSRETPQASPPQGSGSAFDLSAPPVRLQPEPADQSLFGLPGIAIFGAHFRSRHLAMLLGATVFLGWRGFLLGSGIWVIYKLNAGSNAPAAPPSSGQAQGSGDITQRIQNLFSGASTNRAYDSSRSPWAQQQQRPGQATGQADTQAGAHAAGWQGKGQGQKLGSS